MYRDRLTKKVVKGLVMGIIIRGLMGYIQDNIETSMVCISILYMIFWAIYYISDELGTKVINKAKRIRVIREIRYIKKKGKRIKKSKTIKKIIVGDIKIKIMVWVLIKVAGI